MWIKRFTLSIVLFILLVLPSITLVSAASMWSQTYEVGINGARVLVETSDGGYALAGGTVLLKTDAYGNIEWSQTYVGEIYSLVITSDGGFALAGYTNSAVDESEDFWLVKTDEYGNTEWTQTYGGTNYEHAHCLVQTSDGGYALGGETGPTKSIFGTVGNPDFWLVKTDASGNLEWSQIYGVDGQDDFNSLIVTSDGGYAIAGATRFLSAGGADFWLIKTDVAGNVEWNQTYGGTSTDVGRCLVATSDGGYAIVGATISFGAGAYDFWLVKTDASGNMEWNQTYGGTEYDQAYCLVEYSYDGGFALTGVTESFGAGSQDCWLVKTDASGNVEWNQTHGGTDNDRANCLIEASDGGYALVGRTDSFGASVDSLLVKTDEYGIVPEYFSGLIISLLLTVTLVIVINRKRLFNPR